MTKALIVRSQKGTEIALEFDADGIVAAQVNGTSYHDVRMYGSKQGKYIQLAKNVAALIAPADVLEAEKFFAAAGQRAQSAATARARSQHESDMQDPAYAAQVRAESLAECLGADMNRRYSDN